MYEPKKKEDAGDKPADALPLPTLVVDNAPGLIASNQRIYSAIVLSAAALLSLLLFVPVFPIMPGIGLDPSWVIGVNQATAQGLQFGSDILFTAGPLAAVWTQAYHPDTFNLAVLAGGLLAIGHTFIAYQLGRTSFWLWFWMYFACMIFLVESRDALFLIYPLMSAFLIHRQTLPDCGTEGIRFSSTEHVLLGVVAATLGLLPVVKLSFMPLAFLAMLVSASSLWCSRHRSAAALFMLLFFGSLCFFWVSAAQELKNLLPYFTATYPIISGFAEAMSRHAGIVPQILFVLCSLLVFFGLATGLTGSGGNRGRLFAAFFAAFCFLAYKAGFVRQDVHALTAASCVVIAASLLLAWRTVIVGLAAPTVLVALVCWTVIHVQHSETTFEYYKPLSKRLQSAGIQAVQQRLAGVSNRDLYFAYLNAIRERRPLPVVGGTTDILPFEIATLLASGNRWSPRPVFQSYSAYTPDLAMRNAEHWLSDSAAQTLFFRVAPIDDRYPALDDGASWPVLLSTYDVEAFAADYLVLTRGKPGRYVLTEVQSTETRLGERVSVADESDLLFARIEFGRSLTDKLIGFVYKPSTLKMTVTLANGETHEHRLVAGMAKSGFVLSPYIRGPGDLASIWQSAAGSSSGNSVRNIRIEEGGVGISTWQDAVTIRLFRLEIFRAASS